MYLIITRSFPPELGGMQNLMWGLTNALSKHYLVKVFADFHEDHKNLDKSVSFSITRVGGVKLLRKYRKAYLINDLLKKNQNIKGVIADHWKSLELIKTNKKKICLIHSKEINHEKGTNLNKRVLNVLNNIDHVISNSSYTKKLAISCGVDTDKIIVINPGVDPIKDLDKESLSKAETLLKNKKPRLITVSRFDKRKNHEKIIFALRNLKQIYPNIVYTCIGYGDEENNIKKIVSELGLNEQVFFIKNISNNLKNSLVAKSNIFLMPSIIYKKSVEGFGIAFIEAAQYGLPSLGGIDGGASDAIINNKTGILCDGNDLNEIYTSIETMLLEKKYIELGNNAKKNAENFQWDKIILKYQKILN
ncbi:glycosyltransferase family 4 protein [Candidatus Pelagibacter sp.]|nr:glycosyltransferase family 4 protein [Candidatus Pelagibacter sp.]|tara:strand:- start:203 stop:1288 length:1086 start_codon:yes stop_codon:yes gene_type:complete